MRCLSEFLYMCCHGDTPLHVKLIILQSCYAFMCMFYIDIPTLPLSASSREAYVYCTPRIPVSLTMTKQSFDKRSKS